MFPILFFQPSVGLEAILLPKLFALFGGNSSRSKSAVGRLSGAPSFTNIRLDAVPQMAAPAARSLNADP